MTRRTATLFAVMLAMSAVAVVGFRNNPPSPSYVLPEFRYGFTLLDIAWELASAWAFIGAGLIADRRRPGNPAGLLMIGVGGAVLLWGFRFLPAPPLVSLSSWLTGGWGLAWVLIGALVLLYPDGRVGSRLHWGWLGLAAAYLLSLLAVSLVDPSSACVECRPLVTLSYDQDVLFTMSSISGVIQLALFGVLTVLVIRRWVRATPAARRALLPVFVAGIVVTGTVLVDELWWRAFDVTIRGPWRPILDDLLPAMNTYLPILGRVGFIAFPAALLWGLLGAHFGQVEVARLARELRSSGPTRPPVREAVRRALGDPTLEILLWSRQGQGWIDLDGRPGALPETADQAVTRLAGDDGPLAALVYDPALNERRGLVEAVASVAQLALENERLHAEVKAQLEEVRASRERIVRAADEERRRVERNIHDGAQQRLVSLSLALSMAHAQASDASPQVAATLADAGAELRAAITDLRELARGIHPAILTEAGLGPALASLADHSPIPVTVNATFARRLPPLVEATAYYIAAEALTNVAKHAAATTASLDATMEDGELTLVVSDNGSGGADPAGGSGLRGMLDRVAAVGGQLDIEPARGGGTCLRAVIPFA